MTTKNIIRAWKDADYRNSLSENDRASLPPNPAGSIDVADARLDDAAAGAGRIPTFTVWCTFLVCP